MDIFTRIFLGFLCPSLCGGKVEHLDICVMLRPLAGHISRGCLILKVFVMSALYGHWSRPLWPRLVSVTLHCGSLLIAGHPPRGGMLAWSPSSPAQELALRTYAKRIPFSKIRHYNTDMTVLLNFQLCFFCRERFKTLKNQRINILFL